MPPRHAKASAKIGSPENSSSGSSESEEDDDVIYVSSTAAPLAQQQQAPAPLQAPRPSAAPGVTPSYRVIGKKPVAYVCPNRHTAADAAAALVILRELRGVLGRVSGAADAGVAAALALAIPRRVLRDATDAVDAAVDRNARVVAGGGGAASSSSSTCVCASCWPSYAPP